MQIKTIETTAGVNKIVFNNDNNHTVAHFYWLKNLGNSILYVSFKPNPIIGSDDVAELPIKGAVSVETDESLIYILGAGKVEIHRTDSKICPFILSSTGTNGSNIKHPEAIEYALKQAGYNVSSDPDTWGDSIRDVYKDYDYRVDYAGIIFISGGYEVVRGTDKLAYCGYCTYNGNHFMPILISGYPDAVKMTMGGYPSEGFGEITYDGETFYYSSAWTPATTGTDTSGYNRRYLGPNDQELTVVKNLYNEIKMLGYSLYE